LTGLRLRRDGSAADGATEGAESTEDDGGGDGGTGLTRFAGLTGLRLRRDGDAAVGRAGFLPEYVALFIASFPQPSVVAFAVIMLIL
jgi:hypothetical protein